MALVQGTITFPSADAQMGHLGTVSTLGGTITVLATALGLESATADVTAVPAAPGLTI